MNPQSGRIWINFRELRSRLQFEEVLALYNVEVNPNGKQHQGHCPLPRHGSDRKAPSFSVHLERGIFQCFGCKARGNVLEFAALMDKVDPENGVELRKVAVKLQRRFFPDGLGKADGPSPKAEERLPELPLSKTAKVNEPIDFKLKELESDHEFLRKRGFDAKLLADFGVGFCSRGLFKDRIAIAIHNPAGKLVGYAGRAVNESRITTENPKYLWPSRRERDGVVLEFDPTLLLYNAHRVGGAVSVLIVVPGFPAVWWLAQNGLGAAVSTMDYDVSAVQAEEIVKLVKHDGRIVVISDGGPTGTRFATSAMGRLAPERNVRWLKLPAGKRITSVPGEELQQEVGI